MPVETGIARLLDFELKANKAVANGYCDLDASVKVPLARLYSGSGAGLDADTVDLKHAADFLLLTGGTMTGDLEIINTYGLRVKDGAQYGYLNQTGNYTFLWASKTLKFYDVAVPLGATLSDLLATGATTFLGLTDTPAAYAGTGNYYVCVNAGETALEFVAAGAIPGGPFLPIAGGTLQGDLDIFKSNPTLNIVSIDATSPVLNFKDSTGHVDAQLYTSVNDTILVSNYGGLYLATAAVTGGSLFLETKGVTRLTIEDAGMTAAVPLAMGANKITGLAAGTVNGDALRYEQLIGQYLLLTGGTLTGDLTIDKATPALILKHSGTIKGYVQATATEFDVYPSGVKMSLGDAGQVTDIYGSTITSKTGAIPVTRLTIADALITAATDIVMDKGVGGPTITLKIAGVTKGAVTWHTVDGMRIYSADLGIQLRTGAAGVPILLQTNSVTRLTIADAGITFGSSVISDLTINKATPALILKDSGTIKGYVQATATEFDVYPSGVKMSLGDAGQVTDIYGSTITSKTGAIPVTRLTIADAGITFGSSVISDLTIDKATPALILKHSGTIKGYVQATATEFDVYPSGVKMSLGDAGQVTDIYGSTITSKSDFIVDKATPALILKHSGTIKGYVQATATEFDVYPNGVKMSLGDAGQVTDIYGSTINAKAAIAMGTNKITGLGAATAAGDAVRFEQRITYSIEVCDNNVGINPADASTYYFGHIGIAASTTANAQSHLRKIPQTGIITAAMFVMYATTAGTNENITVNIRLNNTGDTGVATVGVSALVRTFSNTGLNLPVTAGDTIEIKILYPTWATNPLVVTWDGTLIITT